jgi:hypothetical protein
MKNLKKSLLIVFSLIAFGTTVQAQNWHEVYDNHSMATILDWASDPHVYIRVTNDITLEAYFRVGENEAQTVTIDLNGHTLQRTGLTEPDANGHVIEVFNNGVLTLTSSQPGGKIVGGWANNGGGICNYGSLTIGDNVTITGCKAKEGGGIKNNTGATLTINGGCITGNIATGNGCGIWNNGTLNMQGNVTITGNTREDGVPQNVFLKSGKMITMTGSFTDGAQVAVFLEAGSGKFTSGYGTHNSGTEPSTYFTADIINQSVTLSEGEAMLSSLEGTVYYIEREWDSDTKKVKATQKTVSDFHVMNNNDTILANNTWYVVNSNVAPKGYLKHYSDAVKVDGTVNLIICDGAKLTAAIDLEVGSILNIYTQSFGTGMIDADGGIGPGRKGKMGDLFIHGGIIDATSDDNDAGIGTCYSSYSIPEYSRIDGGSVTIYDGTITATGGDYGAGIGGGSSSDFDSYEQHIKIYGGNVVANGGKKAAGIGTGAGLESEEHENDYLIEIYGGNVEAHGGKYGAGIGSGQGISAGTLKVYGGIVKAYGGEDGAGIGCGERTTATTSTINGGKVYAYGGKVYAYGGKYGAGIGGGQDSNGATVEVNDGYVFADGGTDAAGIGSGEKYMPGSPNGGKLTINGGHVFADGTGWGAGIGGGEDSDGAEVIINGGIVEAYAGSDAGNKSGCAIGSEDGDGHRGSLNIGSSLMVHAGSTPTSNSLFTAPERVPACYYRPYARIEPCNHEGATYTVSGNGTNDTHTFHCSHCLHTFTHQHTFDGNHVCTVCGVSASVSTASIYIPEYNSSTNTYGYSSTPHSTQQLVTGSTFQLPAPPDNHIPAGVRFVGWRVGGPIELGLTDPRIADNEPDILPAGSSYTINGDVNFTPRYKTFHVFTTAGNWNDANNWCWNTVPTTDKEIVIAAAATVPADYTAQLGNSVTIDLGGSITIADGGQLSHPQDVQATLEKQVTGYTAADNGWYTIASPITGNYSTESLVTDDYDLYLYHEPTHYWWNAKGTAHGFNTLADGQGYLYANGTDKTLAFPGVMQGTGNTITLPLSYTEDAGNLKGFNLLGNPFTLNLTSSDAIKIGGDDLTTFYVVENGGDLEVRNLNETPIKPGQGFMVQATEANQDLVINYATRGEQAKTQPGFVRIEAGNEILMDRAYLQFGGGNTLRKMTLKDHTTQISLQHEGSDWAAATIEAANGEIPVNFKAAENGTYTLRIHTEGLEMAYLHLIDNMTGADVDLLHPNAVIAGEDPQSPMPAYTFTAKTTDYASRFRLVFSICEDANGDNAFAFINNGNIIVNGEGTLQVIDMMGRVIVSRDGAYTFSTTEMTPGVYVLRLINGDDVKTQKVVIE